MKTDSSKLNKEIEELKTELNQLTEMKYAFAECTYRLNLIIAKEKSIIQSLENTEDYGVSSIKGYRNTIKKLYQSQANHLMNLISCSHYLTSTGDKETSPMNNDLFENLWIRYEKEKIDKNKEEYLIEDGLDTDKANLYFEQKIKVLFVLKESNESKVSKDERKRKSIYKGNGWFANFGSSDRKMISKMIKMNNFIKNYNPANFVSTKEQKVEAENRYDFAFINLNKHGNGNRVSNSNLKKIMKDDADVLKDQIRLLDPDVIVFGVKNLFEDFKDYILEPLEFDVSKVIRTNHFSRISYNSFESEAIKAITSP